MPGMCIFIAGEGVFKMTDDKTMEDFDQWWASVSNEAYTSDEKHAAIAGWQAAKERYGQRVVDAEGKAEKYRKSLLTIYNVLSGKTEFCIDEIDIDAIRRSLAKEQKHEQ